MLAHLPQADVFALVRHQQPGVLQRDVHALPGRNRFRRQPLLLQFLRQGLDIGLGGGGLHLLLVPLGFFLAVEDALHGQVCLFKGHFEQAAFVDVR